MQLKKYVSNSILCMEFYKIFYVVTYEVSNRWKCDKKINSIIMLVFDYK